MLTQEQTGPDRESVVNVSHLITLDKRYLTEQIGRLAAAELTQLDQGLRLVLSLD